MYGTVCMRVMSILLASVTVILKYNIQMFLEALNGIDLAVAEAEDACIRAGKNDPPPPPKNNHIFINAVAPDREADPRVVEEHMRELMTRFQVFYVDCTVCT